MPTINQLVRKGRQAKVVKSKSPALQRGFNALKREQTDISSPQKTRCMYSCRYNDTEKNRTPHFVNMRVFV